MMSFDIMKMDLICLFATAKNKKATQNYKQINNGDFIFQFVNMCAIKRVSRVCQKGGKTWNFEYNFTIKFAIKSCKGYF